MDIDAKTTRHLNPNTHGDSLPVVVRVYQLQNDRRFKRAGFREMIKNDRAVLGEDFLSQEEMTLAPGKSYTIKLKRKKKLNFIAVMAEFRDPKPKTWRAIIPSPKMPLGVFNGLKIIVQGRTIRWVKSA